MKTIFIAYENMAHALKVMVWCNVMPSTVVQQYT